MTQPDVRRWWREPLLQFLIIGAALFALYSAVRGSAGTEPRQIAVSDQRIEALADNFSRTWMRPPTPEEMRGLVADYVRDEVYYREGVAMGLDQDDTVIRRRLRQKMEFLSESEAESAEPAEAELQAYLAAHRDQFRAPLQVTFRQVFVSTEQRGKAAQQQARRWLAELQARPGTAEPAVAGDATLLPDRLEEATSQDIAATFGADFARELDKAPAGTWSGPIASTYGLHLVIVEARSGGSDPALAEIRPLVVREWQAERRQRAEEDFYRALRAKYEVHYEGEVGKLLQQGETPAKAKAP